MKTFFVTLAALFFSSLPLATALCAADLNGLWTKTTSPDPNDITIFHHERNMVKAMGYSEIDGQRVVWYGEGKMKGNHLQCSYRYAEKAIPPGWEPEGVMELTLSHDGKEMTGTARSTSGNWFGMIGFVRARLFLSVEKWAKSNLIQNPYPFSGGRSSPPPTSIDRQRQLGILVLSKQVK